MRSEPPNSGGVMAMALLLITPGVCAALLVLCGWLLVAGLRNGDRPGDVRLLAVDASRVPAAGKPVVLVDVALSNPGQSPVLVSLHAVARRRPDWLTSVRTVRVAGKRARRRVRPSESAVIGVLEPAGVGCWTVPLPPGALRWTIHATFGQTEGRLRTISARVSAVDARPGGAAPLSTGSPRRPAQTG